MNKRRKPNVTEVMDIMENKDSVFSLCFLCFFTNMGVISPLILKKRYLRCVLRLLIDALPEENIRISSEGLTKLNKKQAILGKHIKTITNLDKVDTNVLKFSALSTKIALQEEIVQVVK